MTQLPLLNVTNFTQIKGGRYLFENLSLEVMSGQVVVLRGPNGSGKTTLLRCLAGIPDAFPGVIISPNITTSYVGHLNALKARLTVRQNLLQQTNATLDHVTAILRARDLLPLQDREVRTLSVGQRRQIALARLSLSRAKLWLVDEPTTHLDDASTAHFWATLEAHIAAGGAAVLTSHTPVPLPEATVVTLND